MPYVAYVHACMKEEEEEEEQQQQQQQENLISPTDTVII